MNKYIKRKPTFGGSIPESGNTNMLNDIIKENPLSQESDPRVQKLKKELQKLSIAPKPKYIKLFKI